MIMVSACLFGVNCKYNGKNNYNPKLCRALQGQEIILFCPEQAGGLPAPRPPAEIQAGDGQAVLKGEARVVNKIGEDLTRFFIKGAEEMIHLAGEKKPGLVILKSRSPSCGVGQVYDGSFTSHLRSGDGVASAWLKKLGIPVMSDEEFMGRRDLNQ
ncbi:MAG: DUF523 domain-containing protein [Syntrophomonadaceae bacterium]